jgi:hypothetical protein
MLDREEYAIFQFPCCFRVLRADLIAPQQAVPFSGIVLVGGLQARRKATGRAGGSP